MKRILATLGTVFVFLGIASCTPYTPHARVVRANYNVSRGEYQAAIVDYLRALESEQYELWLSYNLANVYHYLGESGAAVERWDDAQGGDVADLIFGAAFNSGVYLYERGHYEEAFDRFRYALTIDPMNVDAKQNLELTLGKISAEAEIGEDGDTSPSTTEVDNAEVGGPGTGTRMLDYVRRKEEQRWRASSESTPETGVRDW